MNFMVVLLLAIAVMEVSARPKCEVTDATAEECGQKLIFIGEHSTGLPKNEAELMTRCNDINDGLQCLKKYSKSCLDPFTTQMMNVIIRNGDRMEAKNCKDDSGRKELLNHFLCVERTDAEIKDVHLCMEKFVVQMEHLSNVSGDHRIPATCCSFQMLDQCVKQNLVKLCKNAQSVEFLNKFLTEITGELVKTGCGKFESLSHCDNAMDKKEWKFLKDLVSSNDFNAIHGKRMFSSAFVALKNIIKQLMEE